MANPATKEEAELSRSSSLALTMASVPVKKAGSFLGIGIAKGIGGTYLHRFFMCKLEL